MNNRELVHPDKKNLLLSAPVTFSDNDNILVSRATYGDRAAFDKLVLKYQTRIAGIIGRLLGDPNNVMDMTQETFIKAYCALGTFKGNSAFFTWLYRIAINTVKNYRKHLHTIPEEIAMDFLGEENYWYRVVLRENTTPENLMTCDEMQSAIVKVVDELPEELRIAIVLREMEGFSYEKIAATMKCPVGTVRSRIFRARTLVDDEIRDFFYEG